MGSVSSTSLQPKSWILRDLGIGDYVLLATALLPAEYAQFLAGHGRMVGGGFQVKVLRLRQKRSFVSGDYSEAIPDVEHLFSECSRFEFRAIQVDGARTAISL